MTATRAAANAPAPVAVAPAATGSSKGQLVLIRPDGTEGDVVPLAATTNIGRDLGAPFQSDSYLSPNHAIFEFKNGGLEVRDQGSLNGVYVRVPQDTPIELKHGSVFRIGQEIILFEAMGEPEQGDVVMGSPNPGYLGRIRLIIGRETFGNSYPVQPSGMHLGRERGDIIFPDDGYVSGLHCRIYADQGKVFLTDVGSSNGTFVRISATQSLDPGSLLLMGQQLFRVEY